MSPRIVQDSVRSSTAASRHLPLTTAMFFRHDVICLLALLVPRSRQWTAVVRRMVLQLTEARYLLPRVTRMIT